MATVQIPVAFGDHSWTEHRVMVFDGQHDTHIETGEDYDTVSLGEVFVMSPTSRDKRRSPACIPSGYCGHDGRDHARQREVGSFVALCGDVDKGNHPASVITEAVDRLCDGAAWLVYSSAHARDGDMRWRIIIPLAAPVRFDDWYDAQNAFFTFMESAGIEMDHALDRAAQPVYLPNVPAIHVKSNTPLRDASGTPLYFHTASSGVGAPGLSMDRGAISGGIAAIRRRRALDDADRERLRQAALRRRINRPMGGSSNVIGDFNAANDVGTMLALCGYEQSARDARDWRSPQQTGETYATRIMDEKWVSLSASDAASGLGEKFHSGCYGDAYDLFVHFKHSGDHKSAFRELHAERRAAHPNVVWGGFATCPPAIEGDPGWQEMPDLHTERQAAATVAEAFDCPPADLWSRYEPPLLPDRVLPGIVERFARTHAETMGCDPAGLAMAALTACAAAIPDRIKVQVKRHDPTWTESARLWTALIGQPSTKKTPIMSAALRPLNKIDAELFSEYVIRQEEYEALDAKERKATPKPQQRRLRISDATIEAAQEVLKDSPDGVLSQQDELSGWFGAMDKYSAGKGAMADRGFWLQAFNGGSYALNRISRGAALIPNLSISILGGIQPDPLRRIVSESVDDGLIQRLLPVQLRPAVLGKDEPQDDSVRRYGELVRNLWLLQPPHQALLRGEAVLNFSEAAHSVRSRLEARHLEMISTEVISAKMAAHFGKYDGIFARLCVLWHCIENVDEPVLPRVIEGATAERVEAFMGRFIVPSAIAFYTNVLGLSDDHDTLIELASYILSHRLSTVQHRDCQRASRSLRALTVDQSRRLFEKLESFGWLEPTETAPKSNSPRWRVNPAAHEVFANRGLREKERRVKARDAIGSIFAVAEV